MAAELDPEPDFLQLPLMSLLSRLFGKAPAPEPVLHKGCRIFVQPIKEASGFRVAARIEKEVGGVVKVHQLIRSDVIPSLEEAKEITLGKAKLVIDQLGDSLFQ